MDVEGLIERLRRMVNALRSQGSMNAAIYMEQAAEALSRQKAAGEVMAEALTFIAAGHGCPSALAQDTLNSIGSDRD